MSLSTLSGQVSVSDKILSRQMSSQTISTLKSWKAINNLKIFPNPSVEKEKLSTVSGFEPGSFDCRSTNHLCPDKVDSDNSTLPSKYICVVRMSQILNYLINYFFSDVKCSWFNLEVVTFSFFVQENKKRTSQSRRDFGKIERYIFLWLYKSRIYRTAIYPVIWFMYGNTCFSSLFAFSLACLT